MKTGQISHDRKVAGASALRAALLYGTIAVTLCICGFLTYDGILARRALTQSVTEDAQLLAALATPALTTDTPEALNAVVSAVGQVGGLEAAVVRLDPTRREAPGVLIAGTEHMGQVPTRFEQTVSVAVDDNQIEASAPITVGGRWVGQAVVRRSTQRFDTRFWSQIWAAAIAILAGLLIAHQLGRRVLTQLDAHMEHLCALLADIATHGVGDARARMTRHPGFGPLSIALNDALDTVQAHSQRLEQDRAQLGGLIDALPDPVYLLDAAGQFVGEVPDEGRPEIQAGCNLADVLPPTVAAQCIGALAQAIEDDQPQVARYDLVAAGLVHSYEGWFAPTHTHSEAAAVFLERDVTELRHAEEQLRQSEKMRSLGQLTGGIAHDFNNLLAVVLGNLELLDDELEGPANDELLRPAIEAAQRGALLTKRLLAFARRQPLAPRLTDPNELIDGMSTMLRRALGESVDLEVRLSDAVRPILVDPGQLENALLNLAVNARDAMLEGGKLTIETANCTLEVDGKATDFVMVAASDTGHGVSPAALERVFDPFFTTKDQGKGTGLGLSMVYGFCKQSGGDATIHSTIGRGTTVKLYLPQHTDAGESKGRITLPPTSELHRGRGERVLVVEDDQALLHLATRLLNELNYTVFTAISASEADQQLASTENLQLLFTDVVLPEGRTGVDVARAARAIHPHIRILFTSGYTQNALMRGGTLRDDVNLLDKPYGKYDLARRIAETLASPPDDLPDNA